MPEYRRPHLEARIDLEGAIDKTLGIPTLRRECAIAEKFLANADRGLDESTLQTSLRSTLDSFKGNRSRSNAHIRSLGVENTQTLRKGIQLLGKLVREPKRPV